MPDLSIEVEHARVVPFAAAPTVAFGLRVANRPAAETIHNIALRCQIQIEATHRQYDRENGVPLLDLFGAPARWNETMHSILWTHASAFVPSFEGSTAIEVHVGCSFDFNVAATKYFYGLTDGEVPLLFLFSGSIFYEAPDGALQVYPISWEKEARFRLPIVTWRELMDAYYPNTNWLVVRRDTFDRLYRYKLQHGIPTWDAVIEQVLDDAGERVVS